MKKYKMNKRWLDYSSSVLIAVCSLFIILYVLATRTTLFTSQGSQLNQGYAGKNGSTNLNIVAISAMIALIVSIALNRMLVKKQSKGSRIIRDSGLAILVIGGILFLIFIITVAYLLLSGHFLEGWQF